eukprot:Pgem_evm1s5993
MHTHGLHISGYVDDVGIDIVPGESHLYEYEVASNHAGGTHWYHSHRHGSTAIQAGGGAAG